MIHDRSTLVIENDALGFLKNPSWCIVTKTRFYRRLDAPASRNESRLSAERRKEAPSRVGWFLARTIDL